MLGSLRHLRYPASAVALAPRRTRALADEDIGADAHRARFASVFEKRHSALIRRERQIERRPLMAAVAAMHVERLALGGVSRR